MSRRIGCLILLLTILAVDRVSAAVSAPPEPANYQVLIRYQISAYRSERIRQYHEMMDRFRTLSFKRDPDDVTEDEADNPDHVRIRGLIPARSVPKLLQERHVRAAFLVPEGSKPPEKGAVVRVDLTLKDDLPPDLQGRLQRQTADVLAGIGFKEAVGYDHRGFTRLLGSLPANATLTLTEDLRSLPDARSVGPPFSLVRNAVRAVYARPDLPLPAIPPPEPKIPEGQERLSPELRDVLADAARAGKPMRMEVILSGTPRLDDREWSRTLTSTGAIIEGRLGPIITVLAEPKPHALALAALPFVVGVRLPRAAQPTPLPGTDAAATKFSALESSGLARLHSLNRRGQGTRIALVASDFTGWESLLGRKDGKRALPDPTLIDLTRERNRDLEPDPFPPGARGGLGAGTREAQALLRAAPEAELTLLRIDPSAPYMLEQIGRAICGERTRSFAMDRRSVELRDDMDLLSERRAELLEERKRVLNDLRDDDEPRKAREAYFRKQAAHNAEEVALRARTERFLHHGRAMERLHGIRIVANSLIWQEGYPVDGSGPLSRFLDDDGPLKCALWFQAAGDSRGQAWSGVFRDVDRNGVLEFTAPSVPLLYNRWTHELNFLGWQPAGAPRTVDLPAGVTLRVSLQWREAHDPTPLRVGEDTYREPLSAFRLVAFRQLDATGKTRPADDLEIVARSTGVPMRLTQSQFAATYEQTVEFKVPAAGRYAIRIEGRLPESIFAPGENRLPINRRIGEVRPRLFVTTLQGAGRAVWIDYFTEVGSLGMPADAGRVVTVGAADRTGLEERDSAGGPPYNLTLLTKPDVLAYDEGDGTGAATAFAAGLVATANTAGVPFVTFRETLRVRQGTLLRVPEGQLRDNDPRSQPAACPPGAPVP
jgi:hypothetical protein